jgi:hypothetical protein
LIDGQTPVRKSASREWPQERKQKNYFDLFTANLARREYIFGLRISPGDLSWKDLSLAVTVMKLTVRCRAFLPLGLTLAAFCLRDRYDTVLLWFEELVITSEELKANPNEIRRLIYVSALLQKPLKQEFVVDGHLRKFVLIPPFSLNDQIANGYEKLYQSVSTFVQRCDKFEASLCTPPPHETYDNCTIRLSRLMESIRREAERNLKLWVRFWSNVVVDNAPWDPSRISSEKTTPRWKRDPALYGPGIPCRMKRNRAFKDHVDASIARDTGNLQTAENQLNQYREQLLKKYRENAVPKVLELPMAPLEKLVATAEVVAGQELSTYDCEFIRIRGSRPATFDIFPSFVRLSMQKSPKKYHLMFSDFRRVLQQRRFRHPTAIEIFLVNGRSYLVNFPQYQSHAIVKSMNLPDAVSVQKQEVAQYFQSSGLQQSWVNGQMSNFEYLLALNSYSGRSFNDPSQYPFFPWTIANFQDDPLDLSTPKTFRDLTKPIGAIGAERFAELQQRMHDMKQFRNVGYLYSSYAICPLSLYLWMIRMEPFTSLHIEMQSQKFDHGSRLFTSVPDSYLLVTNHLNDYRELIPEFYFQPEFLHNDNEFDLGSTRGKKIRDVGLPVWAHEDGSEFVYIMRKGLESDYVSETISSWIDLVFGFKQQGPAAEKAANVYTPDMYESIWTPETEEDPLRRAEIEAAMCHVGQIPKRLFSSAHPKKKIEKRLSVLSETIMVELGQGGLTNCFFLHNLIFVSGSRQLDRYAIDLTDNGPPNIRNLAWAMPNDIIAMVALSAEKLIVVLSTTKLLVVDGTSLCPVSAELINASLISCSHEFLAIVSDDATLNSSRRDRRSTSRSTETRFPAAQCRRTSELQLAGLCRGVW